MIMNNILERMWMEEATVKFKVLTCHLREDIQSKFLIKTANVKVGIRTGHPRNERQKHYLFHSTFLFSKETRKEEDPPILLISSQLNPFHCLTLKSFKIHSDVIFFYSSLRFQSGFFLSCRT
jgi:hypothetical protein